MSNIGWNRLNKSPVVNTGPAEGSKPKIDKLYYVEMQELNSKMESSQKQGVRVWNDMVKKIREAGLMEDKP